MSEYTRKPRSSRHNKKHMPRVLLVVCLMLVVMVGSIAGTVAWLTDTTDEVKNTFTVGKINIELTETMDSDGKWTMQMIPGTSKTKNPKVTVKGDKDNVDIWLFVKFVETVDENVLTYTSTLTTEKGWTQLEGVENVWYRSVSASESDQSWELLDGNKVEVKSTVTKADMDKAQNGEMTYTAYAIQKTNGNGEFTPAEAWAEVPKD